MRQPTSNRNVQVASTYSANNTRTQNTMKEIIRRMDNRLMKVEVVLDQVKNNVVETSTVVEIQSSMDGGFGED